MRRSSAKSLSDSAFDDIFEVNEPEQATVFGDGEWRAAGFGDRVGECTLTRVTVSVIETLAQHLDCAARANSG